MFKNFFMSLLSEPLEADIKYKGLYRIFDFEENKFSKDKRTEIYDYYYSLDEGKANYSESEFYKMKHILSLLQKENWIGDMILFADSNFDSFMSFGSKISDFGFAGYDICATSYHFSVIGSELFSEYDSNIPFFSEMSKSDYSYYRSKINEYGLFSQLDCAISFSDYCNYINDKHEHAIESENDWRPICIFTSLT